MKPLFNLSLALLLTCLQQAALSQQFVWERNFGSHEDWGYDITKGLGDEFYLTGYFRDTTDFDPGPGTLLKYSSPGSNADIWMAKYDSSGTLHYVNTWEDPENQYRSYLAVDASGNTLLVAYYDSIIDADPGPGVAMLTAGPSSFLVKMDPAGNHLWSRKLADFFTESIILDPAGNILICGYFNDPVDLDPGPGVLMPTDSAGACLLKLDPSGNFIWAVATSGSAGGVFSEVQNHPSGDIVVCGGTGSPSTVAPDTSDLDPGPGSFLVIVPPGRTYSYVARYTPSGDFVSAFVLGDPAIATSFYMNGMQVLPSGGVLIAGDARGPVLSDLDPGPGVTYSPFNNSPFTLQLDSLGNLDWFYVADSSMMVTDVTTDSLGNVYANGIFSGTIDFDNGPGVSLQTAPGPWSEFGGFVYKLDPDGSFIWSAAIESPHKSRVFDCLPYSQGDLIVFGYFTQMADLAPGAPTHPVSAPPTHRQLLITKWNRDCNVSLSIDSLAAINCAGDPGFASVTLDGPYPPFDIVWGTTPPSADTFAVLPADTLYSVFVTDASGCFFTSWVKPGGPSTFGGFDFEPYLVSLLHIHDTTNFTLLGVNHGCDTLAGTLSFVPDSLLDLISSVPPPDLVIGDTLRWLTPPLSFGMTPFTVSMLVAPAPGTPSYMVTTSYISMEPMLGDADTANNEKLASLIIRTAVDPNSKQVYPAGECDPHYVTLGTQLEYTIHFQNIGTAPAENVVVLDTLDPSLDPATINIVSHSHTMVWDLLPGNVIRFRFPAIHLPDSLSDPAGSKGYLLFEVNHLPTIASGTVVTNSAAIYFDYQPPVITDAVFNTFVNTIPTFHITQSAAVCPGEPFTFPDGTLLTAVTAPTTHTSLLHTTLGCDSTIVTNLSLHPTYLDSMTAGVCPGGDYTFPDGTVALDILSAVTHSSHLLSSHGCDSFVVVTVNLVIVDTSVTAIGTSTLHANASPATYQWMNCTTGLIMPAMTAANFTPLMDGSYAVIVRQWGCIDTSACHTVLLTAADAQLQPSLQLVPNPATDQVSVVSSASLQAVQVSDLLGHVIDLPWQKSGAGHWEASLGSLTAGVYHVRAVTAQGAAVMRLVVIR
jgi:uncharacterized repeat protein (TIGR01451 family)